MKISGRKIHNGMPIKLSEISFLCNLKEIDRIIEYFQDSKKYFEKYLGKQKFEIEEKIMCPHKHYLLWDKKTVDVNPHKNNPEITIEVPFYKKEKNGEIVWEDEE